MEPPKTPTRQIIRSSLTTSPPVPRSKQFRDALAEEQQEQATVGVGLRPPRVGGSSFLARLVAVRAENNQTGVPPAVSAPATATITVAASQSTIAPAAATISAVASAVSLGSTSSSAAPGEDPFTDPAAEAPALPGKKRPRQEEDEGVGGAAAGGVGKKMKA